MTKLFSPQRTGVVAATMVGSLLFSGACARGCFKPGEDEDKKISMTEYTGRRDASFALSTWPQPQDWSVLPKAPHCESGGDGTPPSDVSAEQRGIAFFAWRLFIALNWPGRPATSDGGPANFDTFSSTWHAIPPDPQKPFAMLTALNDGGVSDAGRAYPQWDAWYTVDQMYEGLAGRTLHDPTFESTGWACNGDCLRPVLKGRGFGQGRSTYDQDGRRVRYEVRVDKSIYDWDSDVPFDHSFGQCKPGAPEFTGTVVIKMAWKVLGEHDTPARFLQRSACISGSDYHGPAVLGLVGFHIAQLSLKYQEWIWSTFEHVDNLGEGSPPSSRPSFNDPDCGTCLANATEKDHLGASICKTQVTRPQPTAQNEVQQATEVAELNAYLGAQLKSADSVLQYYRLIGVQYNPSTAGAPPVVNNLRNSVIETYLVGRDTRDSGACSTCCTNDANEALVPVPVPAPDGGPQASSCLACHSGADPDGGIPIFIARTSLCNCQASEKRWLGDACKLVVGVTCPGETPSAIPISDDCPQ